MADVGELEADTVNDTDWAENVEISVKMLFEYDEKEEAEKAARIYAKKLGIPYEGEGLSYWYSLVPQY